MIIIVLSIMKNYSNFFRHTKKIYYTTAALLLLFCFLKNSQNFVMKSLPLYISCLFSMLLKEDIVDIEKPDGICSLTFDADEF